MSFWTVFTDAHTGGGIKMAYTTILIEADEYEAVGIFQRCFGRDPYNHSCSCCGQDYSITESKAGQSLEEFTLPMREWRGPGEGPPVSLEMWLERGRDRILVVPRKDIHAGRIAMRFDVRGACS